MLEQRKVHKMLQGFQTGSMAELHDILMKEGFDYQYKAGQNSYSDTGIAKYLSRTGEKAELRRVAKGAAGRWTGAKVGIIYTSQRPDLWQLIRKARKGR